MSRIGKKPVTIPEKTTVSTADDRVIVKGPLGELSRLVPSGVKVEIKDNSVIVTAPNPEKSALWGTTTAHIKNMVAGVNKPYEKKLIVEGIGFKADVKGQTLVMSLGFSIKSLCRSRLDSKLSPIKTSSLFPVSTKNS